MTQSALAKAIGAHQPYIAALERGEYSPNLDTLAKLSDALQVPPDYFLSQNLLQSA